MIECSHLVKIYKKVKVVDDISFKVEKGEVFALLGPNGAGKTTTIKIIAGLTKSNSGYVRIEESIAMGYSPETPYFHGFLNAEEVLEFYGKLQGIPKALLKSEIERVLKTTGLIGNKGKKITAYSKGMIQRLAFAQALLGTPDILILDEPCAGLDAAGRRHMIELIRGLKEIGITILINSHILADVEEIADRGIIMNNGKVVAEITHMDIMEHKLEEMFLRYAGGETYE